MGQPTNNEPAQSTKPEATATMQTPTNQPQDPRPVPGSASDLPAEALDLATKLFNYAREGNTDALKQYLDAGIPLNLTNHTGDSLLMLAAYHGHSNTVQELLSRGADANALNDRGQAPIAGACFKGHVDVVKELHARGADLMAGQPNAVDCVRMFKRQDLADIIGVEMEGPVTGTPAAGAGNSPSTATS